MIDGAPRVSISSSPQKTFWCNVLGLKKEMRNWEYKSGFSEPGAQGLSDGESIAYLKNWEWKREIEELQKVQCDEFRKPYIPVPVGTFSSLFDMLPIENGILISDGASSDVFFAFSVLDVIGGVDGFL